MHELLVIAGRGVRRAHVAHNQWPAKCNKNSSHDELWQVDNGIIYYLLIAVKKYCLGEIYYLSIYLKIIVALTTKMNFPKFQLNNSINWLKLVDNSRCNCWNGLH